MSVTTGHDLPAREQIRIARAEAALKRQEGRVERLRNGFIIATLDEIEKAEQRAAALARKLAELKHARLL